MAKSVPNVETRSPIAERYYMQYGKAMAAWADVEMALSDWFRRAIQPLQAQDVNADGIFYSARSFAGRADMLKAATDSRLLSGDERQFIRKALKRASVYNTFRAKLAHRVTVEKRGFGPTEDGLFLHEGGDSFGKAAIDVAHLESATLNFDALKWIILTTSVPGGIEPEEGRRLVSLLPKEPHLGADNHLLEELYAAYL